jgi:hydroxymethylglutaryl-CoA reductase
VIATAFAPGKIILLGEHSVVFGQPALAASLPFGLNVRATRVASGGVRIVGDQVPADPRINEAAALIARHLRIEHAQVEVASELPIGGGLGSSAAFAVGVTRALAALVGRELSHEDVGAISIESERLFHGRPSGVDNTVCAHGGLVRFWKGPPIRVDRLRAARPIPIVVGLTGQKRETRTNVVSLVTRVTAHPERYEPLISRLGELTLAGCDDAEAGRWRELGEQMNEAHALLGECELSSPALDSIVQAARAAGAAGAKLTGAGGGGAAIALAPDPEPVLAAIRALGFEARLALVGG